MAKTQSLSLDDKRLYRSTFKQKDRQHPINMSRARNDQKHPPRCLMPVMPAFRKARGVMFVIVWRKHLNHFQVLHSALTSCAPINVNKPLKTVGMRAFCCASI